MTRDVGVTMGALVVLDGCGKIGGIASAMHKDFFAAWAKGVAVMIEHVAHIDILQANFLSDLFGFFERANWGGGEMFETMHRNETTDVPWCVGTELLMDEGGDVVQFLFTVVDGGDEERGDFEPDASLFEGFHTI